MENVTPVTETEIYMIIKSSPKPSCTLDPIPTHLLVDHFLSECLSVIANIVNVSLTNGIFPASLLTAFGEAFVEEIRSLSEPRYIQDFQTSIQLILLFKHNFTNCC